jgi:hypothetical protein
VLDLNALHNAILKSGTHALGLASHAGSIRLYENVSAGERSGIHHPENPRQSSAPEEFSQEQTGAVKESVGFHELGPLKWLVGYTHDVPEHALKLETYAENEGGRPNLFMTFEDAGTQQDMTEAMRPL